MNTINEKDCLFLIIDIQDKLVKMVNNKLITDNAIKIAKTVRILNLPTIITEQYPKGLGATVAEVASEFPQNTPVFEKTAFNALETEGVLDKIKSYGKKQIVICGIETHICVHQTAAALLREGFEVYVVKDACASRNKYEFKQGIELMAQNGAKVSCVEIVLFEWLKTAKNPHFKEIQALIK